MSVIASISLDVDAARFLPQEFTRQLLTILAKAFPNHLEFEKSQMSENAKKFVKKQMQLCACSPLVTSIIWRNNSKVELERTSGALNELDKFNRSPLTLAIANEDFDLACEIVSKDNGIFLEDKISLEITLINLMMRDSANLQIILSTAGENNSWLEEYLQYLDSYIKNTPLIKPKQYRDVFNPLIRDFGQVLDTLSYFNGTPSHYGFIGPSLDLLSRHLQVYSDQNEQFAPIAKCFANCVIDSNFLGNMALATNVGGSILNRINNYKDDLHLIVGGFAGNCVAIAFYKNKLIISNFGIGGDLVKGLKIYNIKNENAITSEIIEKLAYGNVGGISCLEFYNIIAEIVELEPQKSLELELNPIDNCIFINPRAIIFAMLDVLGYGGNVGALYGDYLKSLQTLFADDLAKFMRNHEILVIKRLECCQVAIDYINQHFQEQEAIENCILLRNSLEYVGLKNILLKGLDPEAIKKLKEYTIAQQEITAVKVIEQENQIVGTQNN